MSEPDPSRGRRLSPVRQLYSQMLCSRMDENTLLSAELARREGVLEDLVEQLSSQKRIFARTVAAPQKELAAVRLEADRINAKFLRTVAELYGAGLQQDNEALHRWVAKGKEECDRVARGNDMLQAMISALEQDNDTLRRKVRELEGQVEVKQEEATRTAARHKLLSENVLSVAQQVYRMVKQCKQATVALRSDPTHTLASRLDTILLLGCDPIQEGMRKDPQETARAAVLTLHHAISDLFMACRHVLSRVPVPSRRQPQPSRPAATQPRAATTAATTPVDWEETAVRVIPPVEPHHVAPSYGADSVDHQPSDVGVNAETMPLESPGAASLRPLTPVPSGVSPEERVPHLPSEIMDHRPGYPTPHTSHHDPSPSHHPSHDPTPHPSHPIVHSSHHDPTPHPSHPIAHSSYHDPTPSHPATYDPSHDPSPSHHDPPPIQPTPPDALPSHPTPHPSHHATHRHHPATPPSQSIPHDPLPSHDGPSCCHPTPTHPPSNHQGYGTPAHSHTPSPSAIPTSILPGAVPATPHPSGPQAYPPQQQYHHHHHPSTPSSYHPSPPHGTAVVGSSPPPPRGLPTPHDSHLANNANLSPPRPPRRSAADADTIRENLELRRALAKAESDLSARALPDERHGMHDTLSRLVRLLEKDKMGSGEDRDDLRQLIGSITSDRMRDVTDKMESLMDKFLTLESRLHSTPLPDTTLPRRVGVI